jgi:hypothetical protein
MVQYVTENERRRLLTRGRSGRRGRAGGGRALPVLAGFDGILLLDEPGVTGLPLVGQVLTAESGVYASATQVTTQGQWLRNGAPISGANFYTYTLALADDGAFISFRETATNNFGALVVESPSTGPIQPAVVAPAALTAPTISDTTPTEGQTITITPGTYSGTAPITLARWLQVAGVDVQSLGTSLSFVVPGGDAIGDALRVREVATNGAGNSGNNFSTASSAIVAATPGPSIADATFGPVPENALIGSVVGQVVNTGGTVGSWSISPGPFAISQTGLITVAAPLNFDLAASHSQTVSAENISGTDTAAITINVAEVTGGVQRVLGLTITGTGAPANTVVPFAQLFVQGDLDPADPVLIRRDDTTAEIRTQINVLTTWPDGSVKHALMALECPSLANGVTLVCSLYKGESHSSPGSNINMATALSGRTASIVHTPASGGAHTFNPLASIGSPDWWSGPLYASKRVQLMPIPSTNMGGVTSVRLCVDVGISKDGVLDLDVSTRNDLVQKVGGGIATYARTISIDGVTLHSFSQFAHQMYGWMTRRASRASGGAAPTRPWITHDVQYLYRTNLVPRFDTSLGVLESRYTTNVINVLAAGNLSLPYDNWGMARNGGQVGGRPEIGRLTYSGMLWLLTGRATAQQLAQIHSEVEPLKPYNHHNEGLDRPLNCVDAPKWTSGTVNQNTSPAGTDLAVAVGYPSDQRPTTDATNYMTNEEAHQGAYHAPVFWLSGRRMAADSLASRASWCSTAQDDRYRSNQAINWRNDVPDPATGYAWAANYNQAGAVASQARGRAWTIRDTSMAAAVLPDAWPNRSWYVDNAKAQINVLATQIPAINAQCGDMAGLVRTASGQNTVFIGYEHTANWMNAYLRWSVMMAAEMGDVGQPAADLADWLISFQARAMTNHPTYNWRTASSGLDLLLGTHTGQPTVFYNTFAAAEASNVGRQQNVSADWGTPPGGQQQLGDWQRAVWAAMMAALYSPAITEATRYRNANAMGRFRNERPGSAISPAFPRTDPLGNFLDNVNQAAIPRWGVSHLFTVPPVIDAGQVFNADAGATGEVGLLRFTGSIPRAAASDSVGGYVIVSQPAGNPYSVSQGGVISKSISRPPGTDVLTVYATCFDNSGVETRGPTVAVNVALSVTSAMLDQPPTWEINGNVSSGTVVGTLTAQGSAPITFSEVSGDPNGLFAVNSTTGVVTTTAALTAFQGTTVSPVFRASNSGGTNDKTASIQILVPVAAPVVTASQSFNVELGALTGANIGDGTVDFTGGTPTSFTVTASDPGFIALATPNLLTVGATRPLTTGTFTPTLRMANAGGSDSKTVTINVTAPSYAWTTTTSEIRFAGDYARRVRPGYTGPLALIMREDNTEFTVLHDTADSAITSFLAGTQGYLKTLYDQSPFQNHFTRATKSLMPRISTAGGALLTLGTNSRRTFYTPAGGLFGLKCATFATGGAVDFAMLMAAEIDTYQSGSGGDRMFSLAATDGGDDGAGATSFRCSVISGNQIRLGTSSAVSDFGTSPNHFPVDTPRFLAFMRDDATNLARRLMINDVESTANVTVAYGAMAASTVAHIGYYHDAAAATQAFNGKYGTVLAVRNLERASDFAAMRSNIRSYYGV